MGFFKDFHNNASFIRLINSTFIVLIPKKKNAINLKDFKPISLY